MSNEQSQAKKSTAMARPLRDTLSAYIPQIAEALPATIGPEMRDRVAQRMVKVALSASGRNEDLAKCTQASVVKAVLLSAELGLEPGLLGEAYLVPFNRKVLVNGRETWVKEAQLIPGYRGLIKLARQSGEVRSVTAQVVYQADGYEVELGLEPKLVHRPELLKDRGAMLFAYAGILFRDGGYQIDMMTRSDIEKIRARSQTGKQGKGPWATDTAEMWRKTVLRRLLKYAPLSSDRLARAQEQDDNLDGDLLAPIIDIEPEAEEAPPPPDEKKRSTARASSIASKVAAGAKAAAPPEIPADDVVPDPEPDEPPPAAGSRPEGLARDGSDGSVPIDQEPPENAGDAWLPDSQ